MSQIAVLVAAYNAERWLSQCLDSLLGQTLPEVEILCIDDCSSDRTPGIIRGLERADGRVRGFRKETNGGVSAARNLGIREACGKWLFTLDDDDRLEPERSYHALAEWADIFNADNLRYDVIATATHDAREWVNGVYNAAQLFFRDDIPAEVQP